MHIQGFNPAETKAILNNVSQNLADMENKDNEHQKAQDKADQADRDRSWAQLFHELR